MARRSCSRACCGFIHGRRRSAMPSSTTCRARLPTRSRRDEARSRPGRSGRCAGARQAGDALTLAHHGLDHLHDVRGQGRENRMPLLQGSLNDLYAVPVISARSPRRHCPIPESSVQGRRKNRPDHRPNPCVRQNGATTAALMKMGGTRGCTRANSWTAGGRPTGRPRCSCRRFRWRRSECLPYEAGN